MLKDILLTLICEFLDICRSAYYKNKKRIKPEKEKQDELLCRLINEYHQHMMAYLVIDA